ncbi:MAG: hypothetical protein IPO27_10700 [Bacteroidetes bacterium]|nr:hypothetical protein [Bacteroidota bacterium]
MKPTSKSMAALCLAVSLLLTVTVYAGAPKTQGQKNLESLISKNVQYPQEMKEWHKNAVVRVAFFVDKEGKIKIQDYNSSDTFFFDYVKKQLEREKLYNPEDLQDKLFCYEFRFESVQ